MKYILDIFENEEFWLELDDEGYALRQMIIGQEGIQMSCFEDCLAEGIVFPEDLDGQVKNLEEGVFELKWKNCLSKFVCIEEWEKKKREYIIDSIVTGRIKYFYPQGTIIDLKDSQGICLDSSLLSSLVVNTQIQFKITGYDEKNLWIILEPAKSLF